MPKVVGTIIGGGFGTLDRRSNRRYFLDISASVAHKRHLYRRGELKTLPLMSSMVEASQAWSLLSPDDQNAWRYVGSTLGLSAYSAYIADKILRIGASIPGNAVPSIHHQGLVGSLVVSPAYGHFLLRQIGNSSFSGYGALYISYKSDLIADPSGGAYIKARFNFKYNVGGVPTMSSQEISLDLSSAWQSTVAYIPFYSDQLDYFELEIEGDHVKGKLLFDNFFMQASEGIITKDSQCKDVQNSFFPIIFPAGITFDSVYPPD